MHHKLKTVGAHFTATGVASELVMVPRSVHMIRVSVDVRVGVGVRVSTTDSVKVRVRLMVGSSSRGRQLGGGYRRPQRRRGRVRCHSD